MINVAATLEQDLLILYRFFALISYVALLLTAQFRVDLEILTLNSFVYTRQF
jgi:hypothetical protein